jgi:RNA polymerase sigma-70 factor (ECF subfamily)
MATREADRSLKPGALGEIERSLRSRLRAYDLSSAFIERSLEDALQKGLVEYLRALDRGEAIDNPAGFIVQAGFCRAIDELRREARQADGALVEALIESGDVAEPSTDEVAMDRLEAQELRDAVGRLSPEEQQVLSLRYFDGLTNEASAKVLYCSKRTYRRRLSAALKKLERHLGVPVPEPGSQLAIEIGVVTWVALRGAKVALAQGPLEQLIGLVHGAQDAAAWAAGRARDLAARFGGGGGGEKLTALASSGPGRVVGTCVAACVLAVGGAELAGVGQGGDHHPAQAPRAHHHKEAKKPRPEPVVVASPVPVPEPTPAHTRSTSRSSQSQTSTSSASRTEQREQEATEAVPSQQLEGAVVEEAPAPEPAPETSTSSSSGSSPTQIANEQFGP